MDRNNDGVITRDEWRGSAAAFRELDVNDDGILSGNEIWVTTGRASGRDEADLRVEFDRLDRNGDGVLTRDEWRPEGTTFNRLDRNGDGVVGLGEFLEEDASIPLQGRPSFGALDRNGNGVVTLNEWTGTREEFLAMDTDGDRVLTQQEYRQAGDVTQSAAYRAGRTRGLADGRQAGREDRQVNGGRWDLEGQRELESADAGYVPSMGARADYQAGYRAAFRIGYREGFGPR